MPVLRDAPDLTLRLPPAPDRLVSAGVPKTIEDPQDTWQC
jgi:hypothetical protein